ncbi:MAG TPA: glycosyltransferase family 4 protein [Mycobacteriales bacterium]|jgi:phosphatidylinositol alpha-1,6-mannosyltransferase|nr:glycosyltransferase family 4 protein [Mycobacteriales bacterium]
MTRRLLVVTNDFPPRPGGIQSFVHGVVSRLPPEQVVVLTSKWRGWQAWDATQPFSVVRHDTSVLLPSAAVRRHALELFRERECTDVWFGAAAPLGLLAAPLRAAGAQWIVASTHGHEVGWAALPAARSLLRRIAANVDVVTYLGDYTRARLAASIGRHADRLRRLVPAVDSETFRPDAGGGQRRADLDLGDRPVVVCVSRLMPRKGQDAMIRALPEIRRRVPGAALVLVGGGPSRARLAKLATGLGVAEHVTVTGSVDHADLPAWYGVGDVFAMPCRERLGGLDVEGLGMVFLEAAACALPVVAGRSGGSVDAVLDRQTGRLVDGSSVGEIAAVVSGLLADPTAAAAMGERGREWVRDAWSWESTVRDFTDLLGWA